MKRALMKQDKIKGLQLTRRLGEMLQIGPDIRIQIVSLATHEVRVKISAPKEFSIHRLDTSGNIEGKLKLGLNPLPDAGGPEET